MKAPLAGWAHVDYLNRSGAVMVSSKDAMDITSPVRLNPEEARSLAKDLLECADFVEKQVAVQATSI